MIDAYVQKHPEKTVVFSSMGQMNYLSAMKYCSFVIGNSSSGIVEAPALGRPSINIGDRQKGRMKASSVVDCRPAKEEIVKSIHTVLSDEFAEILKSNVNLYGDGKDVSEKIVGIIRKFVSNNESLLIKRFYDLPAEEDVKK